MRDVVERLLEDVERREQPAPDALDAIAIEWLAEHEATGRFSWRYYFVRYPTMLSAPRGIYVFKEYDSAGVGYGYEIDMLKGRDYRASFTDPFLLALWEELGEPTGLTKPVFRSWDYTGTEKAMKFIGSGTGIRSKNPGFEILLPDDRSQADLVRATLEPFGIDGQNLVRLSPEDRDPFDPDAVDRVQVGVEISRALLKAGL